MYLAKQRRLDQKYAIINDLTKAGGETIAAGDDVLTLFFWKGSRKLRAEQEAEKRKYWQQSSRAWRISSGSLAAKINANFNSQEVKNALTQLTLNRKYAGNQITNLLEDLDKFKDKVLTEARIQENANAALTLFNDLWPQLGQLTEAMVREIRDEGNPNPVSSWPW
ncbi:MAG TPA: hypothetical protein VN345_20740 [Blastocatellia bacterium]|nr:hypothetical protein [Blastocatellia bacterium]